MMPPVRLVGILSFALAVGCAGVKEAPPSAVAQSGPLTVDPAPAGPRQPGRAGDEAVAIEPVASTPTPPAKAPARVSASPPAVEQARKSEEPAVVAKQLEPPLDVAALKARLRDTNAIGIFTKLALKNQVDDLLAKFRTYHGGRQPPTLTDLRPNYELLIMKVQSLIQKDDPALADDVARSREAIWGVLADKSKFTLI